MKKPNLIQRVLNPIGHKKVSEVAPIIGFISSEWQLGIKTGKQAKPYTLFSFGGQDKLHIARRILTHSVKNN